MFFKKELSQELSPTGGKLVAMKCDVSKEEDILSMMSAIKSQFGGADICINNAGLNYNAPLLSGSTEMWRETLEVRMGQVLCQDILIVTVFEEERNFTNVFSNFSMKFSWPFIILYFILLWSGQFSYVYCVVLFLQDMSFAQWSLLQNYNFSWLYHIHNLKCKHDCHLYCKFP